MVRISDLRHQISNDCPFDSVLLIHAVTIKENGTVVVIHITEHYPKNGIAQVDLNLNNGQTNVPHFDLKSLASFIENKR